MNLFVLRTWLGARLHVGEHDSRGANLVEYILLVAFIALIVLVAVQALGGKIGDKFGDAKTQLDSTPTTTP